MDTSLTHSVDNCFRVFHEKYKIPGLHYAIFDQSKILHFTSFGSRNLKTSSPLELETIFPIASMSKSFAAAAVLALRDEKKFSLDDCISAYIPQIREHAELRACRIRDLLSMSAGLPDDNAWADRELGRSDKEYTELFVQRPVMATVPASHYIYSNYGYMLLGRLISNVSGIGALKYINERFIVPLGLYSTKWTTAEYEKKTLATGYSLKEGTYLDENYLSSIGDGAVFGGLFSTLSDVASWVRFLWEGFDSEATNESILSQRSRREMQFAAVLEPKALKGICI